MMNSRLSSLSSSPPQPPPSSTQSNSSRSNNSSAEILRREYCEMAPWYDKFWKDYLDKTLLLPIQLARNELYQIRRDNVVAATTMTTDDSHGHQKQRQATEIPVLADIACGTGEFIRRMSITTVEVNNLNSNNTDIQSYSVSSPSRRISPLTRCQFIGIDASPEMIQQAKAKFQYYGGRQQHKDHNPPNSISPNPRWIHSSAEMLPLGDDSVDVLCSTSAFHFFQDHDKSLQEMYRVLKPRSATRPRLNFQQSQQEQKEGRHLGVTAASGTSLIITDWCADYFLVRLYHTFELLRWSWSSVSLKSPLASSTSSGSSFWSKLWSWSRLVWREVLKERFVISIQKPKTNNSIEEQEHQKQKRPPDHHHMIRGKSTLYPGPLYSCELKQLVENAGFIDVSISTYSVRVWYFFSWGMQTVTASKPSNDHT